MNDGREGSRIYCECHEAYNSAQYIISLITRRYSLLKLYILFIADAFFVEQAINYDRYSYVSDKRKQYLYFDIIFIYTPSFTYFIVTYLSQLHVTW